MRPRLLAVLIGLLLAPGPAWAAAARTLINCSVNVALTATNVPFPAAGAAGPSSPTEYLAVQNTSANPIWINALGGTATAATPSWQLPAGASWKWSLGEPVPGSLSAIATTGASNLTCLYR